VEVAVVIGLILATIWLAPLWPERGVAKVLGYTLAVAAFGVAVASNFAHRDGRRELGLQYENFWRAVKVLAGPTVVLVGVLLAVGYAMESLNFGERAFRFRPRRFVWPLVQEYLLQCFLNRRLQDAFGKGWRSAGMAALIFAGLHAPNPVLMGATFIAGYFWTRAFQREPNLLAVTLSHSLLGFVLRYSLPVEWLPNMRIGWSFWR
jgi:membrane protease YdiL (CAAX protease family)